MRKSGELLKRGETQGSASTEPVIFCCGKTAAASLVIGDAAVSVLAVCRIPAHGHTANQLNIAYRCSMAIR